MHKLQVKIEQFLNKYEPEIVDKIVQLINIRSVNEGADENFPYGQSCAYALDAILDMGSKLGFGTTNYDYHCGTIHYGEQDSHIGLICHMDVVPEGGVWEYGAFNATVRDGFIIGRGAIDNKGPAVAVLYMMLCIKELNIPLKHGLRMFVGCNEESGMSDIIYYNACQAPPVFSIVPDADFPVCYAEKGILSVTVKSPKLCGNIIKLSGGAAENMVPDSASCMLEDINDEAVIQKLRDCDLNAVPKDGSLIVSAKGIASHAARPEGSSNAVYALSKGLLKSHILSEHDHQIFSAIAGFLSDSYGQGISVPFEDELTGRLTHICGIIRLTNENEVLLNFNIRYPVTAKANELLDAFQRQMDIHKFTVTETKISPSAFIDPQTPVVNRLTEIYNEIAHDSAKPFVEGAATYMRHLPNALAFGPNFPKRTIPFTRSRGRAHMPDECIAIQDIFDSIRIYVLSVVEVDRMI